MDASQLQNFYPFLMMALILVVFYFILIRSQKKKEKALKDMISSLKVGDEVASIGGIHGKINRVKDNLFILETGVGTTKSYVTIEKSAIARLISEGTSKESDVAPLEEAADAE
ncbi:preprotein translocase subunit YajC [Monoglobus pectinilyticus]|uniref:preprotein translocase subunit YajC n=1 Tax=Monoglobus pectinilyticus TaxID=1981510 RepID=UPI00399C4719